MQKGNKRKRNDLSHFKKEEQIKNVSEEKKPIWRKTHSRKHLKTKNEIINIVMFKTEEEHVSKCCVMLLHIHLCLSFALCTLNNLWVSQASITKNALMKYYATIFPSK